FDADFVPYPDTLELFLKYFQVNNQDNIAVVGGYQWHVLNKSENWITRGVRSEYAGSYVIERPGREILGLLKQVSGSVYMIKRKVLESIGWGTSITEDFELTLKLYEQGYKVVYTPYIQAPAECVSTLKRLIRQRMRWAEGHSHNIRRMFKRLIVSPKLTLPEKIELLYISPYYLQAAFFLLGTLSWLISETVFKARLPFWTSLWGWSLVLTNFFALPLVNAVGLFLEESEEKDYLGLLSFIALSYILVPFQAYAAVRGFIEPEEGGWFRTPKTGRVTDVFKRGKFYRWVSGILPGRGVGVAALQPTPYALQPNIVTANQRFEGFRVRRKRVRWVGRLALVVLLLCGMTISSLAKTMDFNYQPKKVQAIENQIEVKQASSKVTLEIIDKVSHPKQDEEWQVRFKTEGRADLLISPQDNDTVEDLDFVSLSCGEEMRQPQILANDMIFYPDWECLDTSKVVHLVNIKGAHILKFQFSDQTALAYNADIFTNAPSVLDFEENDLTDYDGTHTGGTGSNSSSSTQSVSWGTYSHHAVVTNGSTGDRAHGYKAVSWPANNVGYYQFYVYLDDLGVNGFNTGGYIGGFTTGSGYIGGVESCIVHIDCAATDIDVRARDSLGYQDTVLDTALNRDQWYQIQVKYDLSGANAAVELWIDGVSRGTWTGTGLPASTPTYLLTGFGAYNFAAAITGDVYIDDVRTEDVYITIPENLWVFLIIIPFVPGFLRRRRRRQFMK
ncbi:glycosyltransferase family 2 protein, partial [bacterium]|nr:glycosyltransferase family 2 protein [bacterium]